MKLTDEQIASIMQKDICCKTILVNAEEVETTISKHELEGWKLVKKTEINNRFKLTFQK